MRHTDARRRVRFFLRWLRTFCPYTLIRASDPLRLAIRKAYWRGVTTGRVLVTPSNPNPRP